MNEKQILREQIIQIATMDTKSLDEYLTKISLSSLSAKAKNFLYKAVNIAKDVYNTEHAIAVSSNIQSID